MDEAVVVDHRDVAGDVPAVVHHLGRLLGLAEVALHHVRALHQQHAGRAERQVGSNVSGSTTFAETPGTGRPTEPSLQSIVAALASGSAAR